MGFTETVIIDSYRDKKRHPTSFIGRFQQQMNRIQGEYRDSSKEDPEGEY